MEGLLVVMEVVRMEVLSLLLLVVVTAHAPKLSVQLLCLKKLYWTLMFRP